MDFTPDYSAHEEFTFICVPETEGTKDQSKRKNPGCVQLCPEPGKISESIPDRR